jgi:arsenate reductase
MKKQVLFLSTGNSCRSQMAEGLVNHFLGDYWLAYSAGMQPVGYVHPLAAQVMAEIGVSIAGQQSKSVGRFVKQRFDLVVTVCDDVSEKCPIWLGAGRIIHMGFPDPAQAQGSEAEQLVVFRQVRNEIWHKMSTYLAEYTKNDAALRLQRYTLDFVTP